MNHIVKQKRGLVGEKDVLAESKVREAAGPFQVVWVCARVYMCVCVCMW